VDGRWSPSAISATNCVTAPFCGSTCGEIREKARQSRRRKRPGDRWCFAKVAADHHPVSVDPVLLLRPLATCLVLQGGQIMRRHLSDVFRDDRGATAIEYGMIAALIAVAIMLALTFAGANLSSTFDSIGDALRTVQHHDD